METLWGSALWRQFGATIDMLDNTLAACPASLWTQRLWPDPPSPPYPPQFGEFWQVAFHPIVWLDLSLSGLPEADCAPPAAFAQGGLDAVAARPARPTRQKSRSRRASR